MRSFIDNFLLCGSNDFPTVSDDIFSIIPAIVKDFDRGVKPVKLGGFPVDIQETEKAYIIEAELPGYKKENIKVDMRRGLLIISAETTVSKEEEKKQCLYKERFTGSITRSFGFKGINEDGIRAKYENGILVVELPKAETMIDKKKEVRIE